MKPLIVLFIALIYSFAAASEKFSGSFSGFLENKGQVTNQFKNVRNDILYSFSGNGFKFFIKRDGIIYEFNQIETDSTRLKDKTENYQVNYHRVEVAFVGGNQNPEVVASGKSKDYLNFYLAYLPTFPVLDAHFFDTIRLKNVFPDIDVQYVIIDGTIKYDFIVAPGGNTENIKLHYKGLNRKSLSDEGGLSIETSLGQIIEGKPYSFFITKAGHEEVDSRYVLSDNTLSFEVGAYDRSKILVIDPTLEWATYYGGNISAEGAIGNDVIVDVLEDNIFCGATNSTTVIATSGSFQSTFGGGQDGYFAKFASDGTRIWATYFGGTDTENLTSVDTDEFGNIYVAGSSNSSTLGTLGTHQPTKAGIPSNHDAILAKFNSSGFRIWSTYFGGDFTDDSYGMTYVNKEVVMVGHTASTNLIATPGSYQENFLPSYVAKFDSTGNIVWSTYYGVPSQTEIYDIVGDSLGNLYFTGLMGPNLYHFFLQKFTPNGFPIWDYIIPPNLATATSRYGTGVGLSSDNSKVYCSGEYINNSSPVNPITSGLIICLDSSGTLLWDTTYGTLVTSFDDIFVDNSDNLFLGGRTNALGNYTTPDAHLSNRAGGGLNNFDGVFIQCTNSGQIKYATYYGGSDNEEDFNALSGDNNGCIYLVGSTLSTTGICTANSFRPVKGPSMEAFLVKFCGFISEPPTPSSNFNLSGNGCLTASITWTDGSGSKTLVVVRQGSSVNSFPVDGSSYNANSSFGSGQDLGSGNFAVFDGTASSVTITNLTPGSTYYLAAFDYNGSGSATNYLTSNFSTYSFTVPPALNISLVTTNESCAGDSDGAVQLTVVGGTTPFNFNWSNGNTNEDLSNINAGSYSVTVTDANTCSISDTVSLTSNPLPTVNAGSNDTICQGENAVLTGSGSGNLLWSNGSSSSSITVNPSVSTNYFLTVTDSNSCSATDSTLVFVYQASQAEISGIDSAYCERDSLVILTGNPPGGTFSGTGVTGNIFTPQDATIGENVITYAFSNDCVTDASFIVLVDAEPCDEPPTTEFNIYDVYTPNGDGVNDFWVIDGIEAYPNNEITIYNRWGNVVYEAKNYANNWDGKSKKGGYLPSATYYYLIRLNDQSDRKFAGSVTLIR